MAERKDAASRLTEAFGESYQDVMKSAVDAQQRNVQLAQDWVEKFTGLLESQQRTNRALAESMESYREVIEKVSNLQEKNTELTRSFFNSVTGELKTQAESSEAVARSLMQGSEKQMEAFQKMLAEAMDSYANLLNAPFALYQKNLEAFDKRSE